MNKLFKLCQRQEFDVKLRRKTSEKGFCERKAKYFFVESFEDAKRLYLERYGLNLNQDIVMGFSNIVSKSDNFSAFTVKSEFANVTCKIINCNITGTETIGNLRDNMSAEEFRDWFNFTNGRYAK